MADCPKCGAENGLDVDDRENTPCRQCGAVVPFPDLPEEADVVACYDCLRSGKAAITTDTELGMISWEQASEGMTQGVPRLSRSDFELVDGKDGWVRVRLGQETMFELLRTPNYLTIQGEQWQFCCRTPMVFIGQWPRARFTEEAEDGDGEALFNEIVQNVVPGLWEDRFHETTGVYVFRCGQCGRRTAHWDIE
jgi:uncharacterized protein CbrC (UPF0167 family)